MNTIIKASVHIEPHTRIDVHDSSGGLGRPAAYVLVGDANGSCAVHLSSHDDAVRLIKAAEQAASFLLTAEAVA